MSLTEVFLIAGITAEEQNLSSFAPDGGSIWHLYQNHRSAASILGVLGLSDNQSNCRVQYKGGLELTTADVLSRLGWCPRTFVRKSKAFHHVREAIARWTWMGRVPKAKPATEARKDYDSWGGAVALFSEGGFCERPEPPSRERSSTVGESEWQAAKLSQNWLFNLNTTIRRMRQQSRLRLRPT